MIRKWRKLAELMGVQVDRLESESLGTLICENFSNKSPKEDRLGSDVFDGWAQLPLVIRVRTFTSVSNTARKRKHPTRVIELAPPGGDPELPGRQGSYLLLDTTLTPARLTVVLFDWDTLKLNADALGKMGIDDASLSQLLRQHQQPVDQDRKKRWSIRDQEGVLEVVSGELKEEGASPVVGRLFLGSIGKGEGEVVVDVLALPRLTNSQSRSGEVVALDGNAEAARNFLQRTVWRRGAPTFLLALLQLAYDAPISFSRHQFELSTTENASPLAWLTLVDALERAAEHQRRQYIRTNQTVRAPSGTIRFNAYMANLARQQPERIPVSRHMLSGDTLENQLFKGMASRLRRNLRESGPLADWVRRRLETIEGSFYNCSDVTPALWMCERALSKPTPEVLNTAVRRCQDALSGRYPGLNLDPGRQAEVNEFEIDIANLFEAAMRRVLAQASGMEIIDGNQRELSHALSWAKPGAAPKLKPDFASMVSGTVRIVGDAKYKRSYAQTSFWPLNREDFQQLCTYLLAWPTAERGVVLMPWTEDSTDGPATQLEETLHTAGAQKLAVFRVDVTRWNPRALAAEPLRQWLVANEP